MHNPESVLGSETHKLLWDFEIQTNNLISTRRPDLVIINKNKRTFGIENLSAKAYDRVKMKESEKKDKYLELAWEWKKNYFI